MKISIDTNHQHAIKTVKLWPQETIKNAKWPYYNKESISAPH